MSIVLTRPGRPPGEIDLAIDHGARGDDSTNNDAAFVAAIAAHVATGRPIYVPAGVYRVSVAVNACLNFFMMYGDGAKRSIIKQTTLTVPVLRVAGERPTVDGIGLIYHDLSHPSNANATALEINNVAFGRFTNLDIYNGVNGIYAPQSSAAARGVDGIPNLANANGNVCFSTHFENISINYCSSRGVDIEGFGSANTGNTFTNIYIKSTTGPLQNGGNGFRLANTWGSVINQLNIEHGLYNHPLQIDNCSNVTIAALHFEGVTISTGASDFGGFVRLYDSEVYVQGWTMRDNIIDNTGGLVTNYALMRLSGEATKVVQLGVKGLYELDTVLTAAPTFRHILTGATPGGASIDVQGAALDAGTTYGADYFDTAQQFPHLKRWNDARYHWQEGGNNVITGTAAPVSGTWAPGDRVMFDTPTAGGFIGKVCTTGGAPGTWKDYGAIAA